MINPIMSFSEMLPRMAAEEIEKVRRLESDLRLTEQPDLITHHTLHGGMYTRTIKLRAGQVITGALIKVATILIVNGHATVFIGGETRELTGYNVIPASAGRKQAFVAYADTDLTMIFPTSATTIEQAEDEFTDEAHLLLSRQQPEHNQIVITGEQPCQE